MTSEPNNSGSDADDSDSPFKAEMIPEFFHEIISRIIPGMVAIIIYKYWSKNSVSDIISSSIGFLLFVVAAWIIGTMLDVGVFALWFFFKKICRIIFIVYRVLFKQRRIAAGTRRLEKIEEKVIKQTLNVFEEKSRCKLWEREYINKQFAMKIFFRNMCELSALVIGLCCLSYLEGVYHFPYLPDLSHFFPNLLNNWLSYLSGGFFFGAICFLSWISTNKVDSVHFQFLLSRYNKRIRPKRNS